MGNSSPDLSGYVSTIDTRVDSHYPSQVVSLGVITELLGMAGGKLSYMLDGDAGQMCPFEKLEFLAPVYRGDYVRATVRLVAVGRTSRRSQYEVHVVARTHGVGAEPSHGEILELPLLVARGTGVTVTPKQLQRITPAAPRHD